MGCACRRATDPYSDCCHGDYHRLLASEEKQENE